MIFWGTGLSDENKCAIHMSFHTNPIWPYPEWFENCPFDGLFQPVNIAELTERLIAC